MVRNIGSVLVLFYVLTGCSTIHKDQPVESDLKNPSGVVTTVAANPSSQGVPQNPVTINGTALNLGKQVVQIDVVDLQTIGTSPFQLTGRAPVNTVVTVNDDIVLVGTDGLFSIPLLLEEGPNMIHFAASDLQGQMANIDLVLIFSPAEK